MCLTYENLILVMARRNLESSAKIMSDNPRMSKNKYNISRKSPAQGTSKNSKCESQTPEPKDQYNRSLPLSTSPSRTYDVSPVLKSTSPAESISKQYAGCKWTEPPSPSTLPHPPKHWMQSPSQPFFARPFQKICQPEQDIAQQLKVLLKVQA